MSAAKNKYKTPREYIPFGIGDRIDKYCYENNISYEEFSRIVDIDRKTIYRLINGDISCRARTLIQIAKCMNVSLDYLVYGEERK